MVSLWAVYGQDKQIPKEITFETQAEKDAYIRGVSDTCGWNAAYLVEDKEDAYAYFEDHVTGNPLYYDY